MKPDYVDGLRDNLDLILMGGYYGEGTRRSGDISHFLLGLHEHKLSAEEIAHYADRRKLPPKLFAFCKVQYSTVHNDHSKPRDCARKKKFSC